MLDATAISSALNASLRRAIERIDFKAMPKDHPARHGLVTVRYRNGGEQVVEIEKGQERARCEGVVAVSAAAQ